MACPKCGISVLFGGVKHGTKTYCSQKCYEEDEMGRVAEQMPQDLVEKLAADMHKGVCPRCGNAGQTDIHKSYSVYSVIIYTHYETREHLLCKKCATKQQAKDLIGSFLLGWWGFPFGLIVTPVQIIRNLIAMCRNANLSEPTHDLKQRARLILASNEMAQRAEPSPGI